ncbi:MAG TPA: DUF4292 domain-containing protein [Anaeromyxobacteraceae bacterium]|nr:DUF4292 domain-containing protein [Anaeromyxobacteraceae bacterium]
MSRAGALALALSAASCVPRAPPPDLSLDPAQLHSQVERTRAGVRSVQGEARVRIESDAFSGTVRQFLAAEKPDRLRLEALDFFGNPAVVLVTEGGRLGLYDARERVFYRGEATAENLSRLVPVALAPRDLVTILCGSAPLLPGTPARAEPGRGVVRLSLESEEAVQWLEVGPGAAVASSRVRGRGGERLAGAPDLAFRAFRTEGGAPFPGEIRLSSQDPAVEVRLEWRSVEPNVEADGSLFRLEPPRGARVVELDRGGVVPPAPPPAQPAAESPPPRAGPH